MSNNPRVSTTNHIYNRAASTIWSCLSFFISILLLTAKTGLYVTSYYFILPDITFYYHNITKYNGVCNSFQHVSTGYNGPQITKTPHHKTFQPLRVSCMYNSKYSQSHLEHFTSYRMEVSAYNTHLIIRLFWRSIFLTWPLSRGYANSPMRLWKQP